MKIEFTGRHMDFTPALRAHVEEHFERVEHLFDGKPPKAHVIIEVERGMHRSEVIINWRNEVLTAESSIPDMYQSISQTIGKIEKQARKLKDKVIDKSHKAQRVATVASPPDQSEKIAPMPRIIETNGLSSKPMTPDEAVADMEETAQNFLIFRNSDGGKVAVVFRRNDGNYGLIQD